MDNKLILLVEDNRDDEALTLRALRRCKIAHQVIVVRDGVEALDYLFARGNYHDRDPQIIPKLILLDLKLPKLNGLEVLKQIRAHQNTKLVPVVMLTTSIEKTDLIAGYDFGCNSYIRKPVNFLEFTEVIEKLGLYWLRFNESPPINSSDQT